MIVLESVGCYFNDETITVYPILVDGGWYTNEGVDVADCSDEWWSRLSEGDLEIVSEATNSYYGGGSTDTNDDAFDVYVSNLNWN